MQDKIKNVANILPQKVISLVNLLLKDEAMSGKLLLAAAVLAMIAVNSPLKHLYGSLWHTEFSLGLGSLVLTEDLRHWVNDGLMAIFFLVVGLEIKREVVKGELRRPGAAVLPITAAIGGMIVPALIYVAFNPGTTAISGWGIPVATDIAFAIGVLALIGSRLPSSLRIFLLTLAIVDDLLAIVIIAVFYTSNIHLAPLMVAVGLAGMLLIMRKLRPHSIVPYVLLGIALWIAVKESGVHATIAGALVGFLAPMTTKEGTSIAERLERAMIPVSTFIVVPLFAFANAAIVLAGMRLTSETWPIAIGIILGLVFGKLLGILGATFVITKLRFAKLPDGANWRHMTGVGLLAGIGFTVSIFITELAFIDNEAYISAAKIGIFAASILAAFAGAVILLSGQNKKP